MDLFVLTRALVDIESITNNERQVGDYLFERLSAMGTRYKGRLERMEAARGRDNIYACWGEPEVTLSTHMDTVPPFFPSREDDEFIWGRGACDAKGIIAAMVGAAERLLAGGTRNFGLLFVVGEERNSAGAKAAAQNARGSRFLINGEPTRNCLAVAMKGALRYEIVAQGKLAHSAYPELGHSAIHLLLDVLREIQNIPLPVDPLLGASTLNIGMIAGGRAPNVLADHAQAEIMFRLSGDPAPIRAAVAAASTGRAEAREVLYTPAVRLSGLNGLPTTVAAFTTDIPAFGDSWGKAFLIGPGNIHLAHTAEERVAKRELADAIEIYTRMVKQLLAAGSTGA